MKIKPMIGEYEVPGIQAIESREHRSLVEHQVPGLAGNYLQDMGSGLNHIVIVGTRHGDDDREDFLTQIRELFNAGTPTTFVADINTATELTDVVVADLQVAEVAGSADSFYYIITLRKYIEPPQPPATGLLDGGILDAASMLSDALDALDALGNVQNLSNPTEPLKESLGSVMKATEGLEQAVNDLNQLLD